MTLTCFTYRSICAILLLVMFINSKEAPGYICIQVAIIEWPT